MNKFTKRVPKQKLYIEYVRSLNGLLHLTEKEILLVTELIKLDINYIKLKGIPKNIVNTQNRKYIQNAIGVSKDNLSRAIKKLKLKGLLIHDEERGEITVNPALVPNIINDRVQITLIIKTGEYDESTSG